MSRVVFLRNEIETQSSYTNDNQEVFTSFLQLGCALRGLVTGLLAGSPRQEPAMLKQYLL